MSGETDWVESGIIMGYMPKEPQKIAVSIPVGLEKYAPQSLITMPMRWVHQARNMKNGGQYLLNKVLRSNVGRKLRRRLRRSGKKW